MHSPLDPTVVLATILYASIGIVVFAVAFAIILKVTPFSIRKEIEHDQNVAVAVVIGAVILGLAHIVAATLQAG
jgi:uncharacterized membrane protein YjfL (UPF0719 family)